MTRAGTWSLVNQVDVTGRPLTGRLPDGSAFNATPSAQSNWALPGTVTVDGVSTVLTWDQLRLSTATGMAGDTAAFTWDVQDRPLSKRLPDGSIAQMTYAMPANGAPGYTKEVINQERWVKATLDGLGRPVREERGYYGTAWPPGGVEPTNPVTESVVETEYGPCACGPFGKVKRVSRPRASNDATVAWTVYAYDAFGRTKSVTHAPAAGVTGNSGVTDAALGDVAGDGDNGVYVRRRPDGDEERERLDREPWRRSC